MAVTGQTWAATGQDALAGAGTGAAIGSAIPGIGTAVGGAVGGLVGGAIGFFGNQSGDSASALTQQQQAALAQQQQEQQQLYQESQAQYNSLVDPMSSGTAYGQSLGLLKQAALGNAPSQAQILMNQGIQQTMGGAYGLAASTNGVDPATSLRMAMMSAGASALQGVGQNAALRATEMANARSSYAQATQNQQALLNSILQGQGGQASSMAGIASGSATNLQMPNATTSAQTGQMFTGFGLTSLGSLSSQNALQNGQQQAAWNSVAGTGGTYQQNLVPLSQYTPQTPGGQASVDWSSQALPTG